MDGHETEFDLGRSDELIEEGVHEFVVEEVEEREGPLAAYLMFSLRYAGNDPNYKGTLIWTNVSLSPQARWKLNEFLDAVGAPASGKARGSMFIGRRLRCQIYHEEFDEVMRAKVDKMLPSAHGVGSKAEIPTTSHPSESSGTPRPVDFGSSDDEWDIPF